MQLNLKPTHAPVTAYYQALGHFGHLYVDHEMAVRSAFQDLLSKCGRKVQLTLVPEYRIERARGSSVIVDGALVDTFHLPHGYWEAKDEKDDLEKEVKLKLDKGYPRDNIIFQSPTRAILYQAGMRVQRPSPCGRGHSCPRGLEFPEPNVKRFVAAGPALSENAFGRRRASALRSPDYGAALAAGAGFDFFRKRNVLSAPEFQKASLARTLLSAWSQVFKTMSDLLHHLTSLMAAQPPLLIFP